MSLSASVLWGCIIHRRTLIDAHACLLARIDAVAGQGRAEQGEEGGQAVKDRLTVQRGNLTYSGGAKYLLCLVPVNGGEGDGEGG